MIERLRWPSPLKARRRGNGDRWIINGRKAFITGAVGAEVGIVIARTDAGDGKVAATMFLFDLPDPAVRIERVMETIDSPMPGGHSIVVLHRLAVSSDQILGAPTKVSAKLKFASALRGSATACAGWATAVAPMRSHLPTL